MTESYCICFADETNLPADIPSYLSSQGTLADRQDGYIPSESGSSHQYIASSISGFYLQPKDMNGTTENTLHLNFESEFFKWRYYAHKFLTDSFLSTCRSLSAGHRKRSRH